MGETKQDQGAPGGASSVKQRLVDSYIEGRIPSMLALVNASMKAAFETAAAEADAAMHRLGKSELPQASRTCAIAALAAFKQRLLVWAANEDARSAP